MNLRMCVMHVSSDGTSLVEGHPCLSFSFLGSMSLFSHFSAVVFMVMGLCSFYGTLSGFWSVRVKSDRSFPSTRSSLCSVSCTSFCLWSFHPRFLWRFFNGVVAGQFDRRHPFPLAGLRARAQEERTISSPELLFRMYMS